MPKDDLKELICDWIGAGKTYMGSDFTFEKELKYVSNADCIHLPHSIVW